MKAVVTLACALLAEKSVVDIIVKYRAGRGCSDRISQEVFERLEPCAVKVACTVLRRRSGSNVALLSDLCRRGCQIFCVNRSCLALLTPR